MTKTTLTDLGLYLGKRSINKAEVCNKTGISKTRMSRLTTQTNAFLRASELYLIALAIEVDPAVLQKELYGNLKLLK
ncbi:helix-turn-helix domain-containing protein [Pedobacter psychroterrae]|uniref:XRE family transcriptional regulator n=1 Tax=Pedobacter psychroterrae TaxID=2530453 RepID=A0A4R0NS45_9SPHI|nr:helix-turn-helix transcriptional regulator [Pedobacter psychroterrae]TCD04000.1 XRE family transcriptional regulator [Pedobacter psychroterrae]